MSQPSLTTVSGFLSSIAIGTTNTPGSGIELPTREWSLTYATEKAVEKNSFSGPFPISLPTYLGGSVRINIARNYASGQDPYTGSQLLVPQTFIAYMFLFENQTAAGALNGPYWILGNVLIESIGPSASRATNRANMLTIVGTVSGPSGFVTPPST